MVLLENAQSMVYRDENSKIGDHLQKIHLRLLRKQLCLLFLVNYNARYRSRLLGNIKTPFFCLVNQDENSKILFPTVDGSKK